MEEREVLEGKLCQARCKLEEQEGEVRRLEQEWEQADCEILYSLQHLSDDWEKYGPMAPEFADLMNEEQEEIVGFRKTRFELEEELRRIWKKDREHMEEEVFELQKHLRILKAEEMEEEKRNGAG